MKVLMYIFSSLTHSGAVSVTLFVLEVIALIIASAICSGLNVALMSLDLDDLQRKAILDNKIAKTILPLRRRTHLTLASILLTNVAAVSATTLVLDQRLEGFLAGLIATLLIVIFGEVIPQALFSHNALFWTGTFAPILKFMIFVTYIVSRPLEILLNRLFPYEQTQLQSRHELGLLLTEHLISNSSELDNSEVEIMRGALSLSEKRVRDIMTDIRHTYWLTLETELDDKKIDEIKEKGFSRIPVFNQELTECYGFIIMKDLVDIDFDEQRLFVRDMELYQTDLIGSMTALDTLLRKFLRSGNHLAPVERDDMIVGIATIEDLIEEIVGKEIEDESDRNRKASLFL